MATKPFGRLKKAAKSQINSKLSHDFPPVRFWPFCICVRKRKRKTNDQANKFSQKRRINKPLTSGNNFLYTYVRFDSLPFDLLIYGSLMSAISQVLVIWFLHIPLTTPANPRLIPFNAFCQFDLYLYNGIWLFPGNREHFVQSADTDSRSVRAVAYCIFATMSGQPATNGIQIFILTCTYKSDITHFIIILT